MDLSYWTSSEPNLDKVEEKWFLLSIDHHVQEEHLVIMVPPSVKEPAV